MVNWLKIERIPGPLAPSYEKATRLAIDLYYAKVADEIAANFRQGRMLDLGTGPGYLPIEILKRAPDIEIIGVDLSRRLIHMARENAGSAGLSDSLSFEYGNSSRLRFNEGEFDMVLSTGMLHSLKQPVKMFKEIYRVLKKGGQAWIFDPAQVAFCIDRKKWKASLSHWDRIFLRLFRALGLLRPIKTYSPEEVREMLTATDFEVLSIEAQKDEIKVKLKKGFN